MQHNHFFLNAAQRQSSSTKNHHGRMLGISMSRAYPYDPTFQSKVLAGRCSSCKGEFTDNNAIRVDSRRISFDVGDIIKSVNVATSNHVEKEKKTRRIRSFKILGVSKFFESSCFSALLDLCRQSWISSRIIAALLSSAK